MKAFKNDLLAIGAVLGLIILALVPVIGLFFLACVILQYTIRKVDIMMQRYGYFVYVENDQLRDTGPEPLNWQAYEIFEFGLMKKGFIVQFNFTDTDYDRVKQVIENTRKGYKEIEENPVDNRIKVPRY